jgi:hypothetical protein
VERSDSEQRGVKPDRDSWCTPKWLCDAIGAWGLDPCSNERSHVRATFTFRLDRGEDGLKLAASVAPESRVFVNPPYGDVPPWVRAYKHARFCFLLKFDPSTRWFCELYAATALVAIPRRRRIAFEPPPGVRASSNPFPHALFYARAEDATDAILRSCIAWRTR